MVVALCCYSGHMVSIAKYVWLIPYALLCFSTARTNHWIIKWNSSIRDYLGRSNFNFFCIYVAVIFGEFGEVNFGWEEFWILLNALGMLMVGKVGAPHCKISLWGAERMSITFRTWMYKGNVIFSRMGAPHCKISLWGAERFADVELFLYNIVLQ